MSPGERKRNLPRADQVVPGLWRLRLPIVGWPAVPHVNSYAIASGSGVVLVDTGLAEPGGLGRLEQAMAQAGLSLEHVRLLVCTHAHSDHYGLAAPIIEAAGCELWMHPAWQHVRLLADDPAAALEQRIEVARQSGVPAAALERYRERKDDEESGIDAIVEPDRELVAGVEVETDLGAWRVHETPGHAPSHVVLHQPERRLMISGDHLLGRTVLFFDHGHSPDPVGEFMRSLNEVEPLEVGLVLAGHGRPFRDARAKIAEARRQVEELLSRVRAALEAGEHTGFEIVAEIVGPENVNSPATAWALQIVLSCLNHLTLLGEAGPVPDTDPQRWRLQ
jgi:glyoxylase-like metal-dependent hydrolase (beta-lactamase superfamily II)